MTGCAWDTGSATGCRPACDAPADVVVTYDGYRGPYVTRLCRRHADILPARIWPYAVTRRVPVAPEGWKLAGCVNHARTSGAYSLTTRGGWTSGHGDRTAVLEAIRRHGYAVGDWTVRHIPTAGETMAYAELYDRDWSLAP